MVQSKVLSFPLSTCTLKEQHLVEWCNRTCCPFLPLNTSTLKKREVIEWCIQKDWETWLGNKPLLKILSLAACSTFFCCRVLVVFWDSMKVFLIILNIYYLSETLDSP